MSNVSLVEHPARLLPRLAALYGQRRFGRPTEAATGWRKLDPHLALLAQQAAARVIGCSWCVDYGYYESLQRGQDPAKVRDVPLWRESTVYSDAERTVLEYAEAASGTPVVVDDDLVRRLHEQFSEEQIVELAAWVSLENYRSRFNAGLGLKSQGFSDACRGARVLSERRSAQFFLEFVGYTRRWQAIRVRAHPGRRQATGDRPDLAT